MTVARLLQFFGGIRTRLIFLALISAVPFVWYRIADIRSAELATLEQLRQAATETAARGAAAQAEVFAEVRTLLSTLANVPVVLSDDRPACGDFLKTIQSRRDWAKNLLVAAPNGQLVCATDPAALKITLGDRAYFQAALAARAFTVSGYIISRLDKQPILVAALPVYGADQSLRGVLLSTLNLSWFNQAAASVGAMFGARVLLVDDERTVLAEYPTPAPYDFGAAAERDLLAAIAAPGARSFEVEDSDGIRRVYGVAQLGKTNARMAVGISIEAALADTRQRIRSAYIHAAAVGVTIILLAWLIGEIFILSPLRDLLGVTGELANGNLAARARAKGGARELRELANSFNAMADRLSALATIDGLTGVANRRRFDQYLSEEWRRALRAQAPIALAMIDVDGFKLFNDRHGHQAGDDCLRIVATELTLFARRSEDLIGRYGGEEFIVGLPGLRGEDAMRHAERIRAAIADLAMPELGIRRGDVTVSIGVSSVIPSPSMTADTLVAMADVALYEAKRAGRNRTSLFQESGVPGAHQAA